MSAPGVYADLQAQRACWHPVCYGHKLGDSPVHADLLGESLVLWRGPGGAPRAMSDLCVHRGTALSLGWVRGDHIVCPYHGWRYAADGRCVAIPQLADPARVPARARVPAYRAQERYGLVWVALAEPRWPLPEMPELEDQIGSRSWLTRPGCPPGRGFPRTGRRSATGLSGWRWPSRAGRCRKCPSWRIRSDPAAG